ncbi:peroxisomal membrane protein PEX16 [Diplogelasinospora grovesii]|uniref:Peroxisomal membrane protein PEX16 n=1 Tax=Diplogelasinospora grovesii TaxID=303347 RepID=A0AAN6NDW5_9PEZI|nr:peroxisomal membrane protein PEX16 [Diplogelasinospora grovesii]
MSLPSDIHNTKSWSSAPSSVQNVLSLPPRWLHMYDEFITKNASQVSQIESALRSLTYIIPGRFRDAEIASESIHSGVQLLSLYHDTLLVRAVALSKLRLPSLPRIPSPHSRYTRFWTQKSALYRRVAYVLQIVSYVELLCEMAAKRRGERTRWRAVVVLEAIKALCRLLLLRITKCRPLVTPVLPEREPLPEDANTEDEDAELRALMEEEDADRTAATNGHATNGSAHGNGHVPQPSFAGSPDKEWTMPRTGMSLPALPEAGDISGYLLSRVLTADDIKPAPKLLNTLQGAAHAAEVLHILAPLVYAVALARSRTNNSGHKHNKLNAWLPWVLGLGVELAARQLRDAGHSNRGPLRTTPLERDEWSRRGWAMGWWAMRGAFYEHVTKGVVAGVRKRVPGLVAGILEDYEYLWENYYFSTSP